MRVSTHDHLNFIGMYLHVVSFCKSADAATCLRCSWNVQLRDSGYLNCWDKNIDVYLMRCYLFLIKKLHKCNTNLSLHALKKLSHLSLSFFLIEPRWYLCKMDLWIQICQQRHVFEGMSWVSDLSFKQISFTFLLKRP